MKTAKRILALNLASCGDMSEEKLSAVLIEALRKGGYIIVRDWQTVEAFCEDSTERDCWIEYKGRVLQAYYDQRGFFLHQEGGRECYMTECITRAATAVSSTAPEGSK